MKQHRRRQSIIHSFILLFFCLHLWFQSQTCLRQQGEEHVFSKQLYLTKENVILWHSCIKEQGPIYHTTEQKMLEHIQ